MKEIVGATEEPFIRKTKDGELIPWHQVIIITQDELPALNSRGDIVMELESEQFVFNADNNMLRQLINNLEQMIEHTGENAEQRAIRTTEVIGRSDN